MSGQLVYTVSVGEGPRFMRVERWTTSKATGLWNRIRRRRTVVDKELLGLYLVDGHMEITRRLNAPDSMTMSYRGRDPLSLFSTKEALR